MRVLLGKNEDWGLRHLFKMHRQPPTPCEAQHLKVQPLKASRRRELPHHIKVMGFKCHGKINMLLYQFAHCCLWRWMLFSTGEIQWEMKSAINQYSSWGSFHMKQCEFSRHGLNIRPQIAVQILGCRITRSPIKFYLQQKWLISVCFFSWSSFKTLSKPGWLRKKQGLEYMSGH